MVHPDYVIGAVIAVIFTALIYGRVKLEDAEDAQETPIAQHELTPAEIEQIAVILARKWTEDVTHEAAHPTDVYQYPLLPSTVIREPVKHDAPYPIINAIVPMDDDRHRWN